MDSLQDPAAEPQGLPRTALPWGSLPGPGLLGSVGAEGMAAPSPPPSLRFPASHWPLTTRKQTAHWASNLVYF